MRFTVAALFALLIIAGCGDSTGPSPEQGTHGWIVGDCSGSTPSIFHTSNGTDWTAQGTELELPGCSPSSVPSRANHI